MLEQIVILMIILKQIVSDDYLNEFVFRYKKRSDF